MKLHTNMKKDYFIANKNDSLETIIKKLFINSNRGLVVIDQKKVVGVITAGDILASLVYKKNMSATASSIMNKSFKFFMTNLIFVVNHFQISIISKSILQR